MTAPISRIDSGILYSPAAASTDSAAAVPQNNQNTASPAAFVTLGQSGQDVVGLYTSAGVSQSSTASPAILGTGSQHTAPSVSTSEFDTMNKKRLDNYTYIQQVALSSQTNKPSIAISA
jgi:hypothetical protein